SCSTTGEKMPMTPRKWSISGLAVEMGVDRRTAAGVAAGLTPVGRSGNADLFLMRDAVAALVGPRRGPDAAGGGPDRPGRRAARATIAELEAGRLSGALLPGDEVQRAWVDAILYCRQRLLAIPTRAAPLVAVETGIDACSAVIESFVHEALAEL